MAVQETRTTKESPMFPADTVLIVAGGLAFALAMLGWLAGHRISLAMPPEVQTRALVPLLVGVAGLFIGAGVGLLLGELKRVEETVTTTTTADGTRDIVGDVVTNVVEAVRSFTPARALLAVGVLLLLATVWLVKPPDAAQSAPAGAAVPEVTGSVSPTELPTGPPTIVPTATSR